MSEQIKAPRVIDPCFECEHAIPCEYESLGLKDCDIRRTLMVNRRIFELTGLLIVPRYDNVPDDCPLMEYKASDDEQRVLQEMIQEMPRDMLLETIKKRLRAGLEDVRMQIMGIRVDPTLSRFQKWRMIRKLKRRKPRHERTDI